MRTKSPISKDWCAKHALLMPLWPAVLHSARKRTARKRTSEGRNWAKVLIYFIDGGAH